MARKKRSLRERWLRFWHRWLRRPVRMKAAHDRRVKNPALTVVFLHGIAATSDTWMQTWREFEQNPELKNVRFVALDLLGFGRSIKSDFLKYNYRDFEKALDASLRKLKVRTPIVLIGHSMGALIAADYATNFTHRARLKQLILVSPPVLMADELAKLPDQVYAKSYHALQRVADAEPGVECLANLVQRFTSFRSKYLPAPAFQRAMDQVILNPENYRTFTKIKTPTLLIHGRFDPLVLGANLKRVAKENPDRVRYVSVLGHHDVSAQKRQKILIELRRVLNEQTQNL